jgi:hypothetical protein
MCVVFTALALGTFVLGATLRCDAGPRLRPGLEAGAMWGGMTGADRFATGGGDEPGITGGFGAALLEFEWPGRWSLATGFRYRGFEEIAPAGGRIDIGGVTTFRMHTVMDLASMPLVARFRPIRGWPLSLELGPQVSWVTHAESWIVAEANGGGGPAPLRARPAAQIFESLTQGLTAGYENVSLEGVVGLELETPGIAHPTFALVRYMGGLTPVTDASSGSTRHTSTFELGAGWRW